ncbi:MAG: hypothetical protein ACOX6T_24120 [Myxococcales bacterium]|jgi:hypothetical protein
MFVIRGLVLAASVGGSGGAGFPDELQPVGANQAQPPAPEPDEPYPERLELVTGSGRGFKWINARGYVHAPIAAVWQALQDPEVVIDRRKVASWKVQKGVIPGAEASFRINNTVRDIITVEFETTWRLGVARGTRDAPEAVAAVYRKTGGTHVIRRMEGSIIARKVSDSVTEIELVEHLDALMRATESGASYNRDVFASIVARAKGAPVPTY